MATGLIVSGLLNVGIGMLAKFLFAPSIPDTVIEGPRLTDLSVTSSVYGSAINVSDGTVRQNGNIIWAGDGIIEEVTITEEELSAKGGPSATQTTIEYRYYLNWAVAFSEGVAEALLRIWGDGKIIYDATGKQKTSKHSVRFYFGNETQDPDPIIAAHIDGNLGAGSTPAYRNTCYVVFNRMALADHGNRPPNITAEITYEFTANYPRDDFTAISGFTNTDQIQFDPFTNSLLTKAGTSVTRINNTTLAAEANTTTNFISAVNSFCMDDKGFFWSNSVGGGNSSPVGRFFSDSLLLDATLFAGSASLGDEHKTGFEALGMWADKAVDVVIPGTGTVAVMACHMPATGGIGILDGKSMTFQEVNLGMSVIINGGDSSLSPFTVGRGIFTDPTRGIVYVVSRWTASATDPSKNVIHKLVPDVTSWDNVTMQFGVTLTEVGRWTDAQLFPNETASPASINGVCLLTSTNQIMVSSGQKSLADATAAVALIDLDTGAIVETVDNTGFGGFSGFWNKVSGNKFVYAASDALIEWDLTAFEPIRINQPADYPLAPGQPGYDDFFLYDETRDSVIVDRDIPGQSGVLLTRVYLGKSSGTTVALNQIVQRYLLRTGGFVETDMNLTAIAGDLVQGNTLARANMTGKRSLEPLLTGFFWDLIEEDWQVVAVKRGGTSVLTIPEIDLGQLQNEDPTDDPPIKEVITQEVEVPMRVDVLHADREQDYQENLEFARRMVLPTPTMHSRDVLRLDLGPLVLDPDDAKRLAEKWLYTVWNERSAVETRVPWRYIRLSAADVFSATWAGETRQLRMEQMEIGAQLPLELRAVTEDEITAISTVLSGTADGHIATTVPPALPSRLLLIDAPTLSTADETFGVFLRGYAAVSGFGDPQWQGATVVRSTDGGITWQTLTGLTSPAAWGIVTTAPTAIDGAIHNVFQEVADGGTVTVIMKDRGSSLATATELAVLNQANAAAFINSDGSVEVFQFQTVVSDGNNSYTLERLLRGRKGTEDVSIGGQVQEGSTFILLEVIPVGIFETPLASRNVEVSYRAVSFGQSLTDAPIVKYKDTGRDRRPYRPAHIESSGKGQGLKVDWVRATRLNGEWLDGTGTVPLNEDLERYTARMYSSTFSAFFQAEAEGASPDDTGTFALTGTLGTEATVQGVVFKTGTGAFEFSPTGAVDPSEAFVSYPDTAGLELGSSPFTIECWVRFKSVADTTQTFMAKWTDGFNQRSWRIFWSGGDLIFDGYATGISATVFLSASWSPVTGTWYHLAITRDANDDFRLFLAGEIVATLNDTDPIFDAGANPSPLWLGKLRNDAGNNDNPMNGFIDGARIIVGEAIYTENFTPPGAFPADGASITKTVNDATTVDFNKAEMESTFAPGITSSVVVIDQFDTDPDGGGGWAALSGTTLSSVANSGNISGPPTGGGSNFALQTSAGTLDTRYGMEKTFGSLITDGPYASSTEFKNSSLTVSCYVAADVVTEQTVEITVIGRDSNGVIIDTSTTGLITLTSNGVWEPHTVDLPVSERTVSFEVELTHTGLGTGTPQVGFDRLETTFYTPPGPLSVDITQHSGVPGVLGITGTKLLT